MWPFFLARRTCNYLDVSFESRCVTLINARMLMSAIDTAWDRITLPPIMKKVIWRTEKLRYSVTDPGQLNLRTQIMQTWPSEPVRTDINEALFVGLDLFFVKVMSTIYPGNVSRLMKKIQGLRSHVHYAQISSSTKPRDNCQLPRLA